MSVINYRSDVPTPDIGMLGRATTNYFDRINEIKKSEYINKKQQQDRVRDLLNVSYAGTLSKDRMALSGMRDELKKEATGMLAEGNGYINMEGQIKLDEKVNSMKWSLDKSKKDQADYHDIMTKYASSPQDYDVDQKKVDEWGASDVTERGSIYNLFKKIPDIDAYAVLDNILKSTADENSDIRTKQVGNKLLYANVSRKDVDAVIKDAGRAYDLQPKAFQKQGFKTKKQFVDWVESKTNEKVSSYKSAGTIKGKADPKIEVVGGDTSDVVDLSNGTSEMNVRTVDVWNKDRSEFSPVKYNIAATIPLKNKKILLPSDGMISFDGKDIPIGAEYDIEVSGIEYLPVYNGTLVSDAEFQISKNKLMPFLPSTISKRAKNAKYVPYIVGNVKVDGDLKTVAKPFEGQTISTIKSAYPKLQGLDDLPPVKNIVYEQPKNKPDEAVQPQSDQPQSDQEKTRDSIIKDNKDVPWVKRLKNPAKTPFKDAPESSHLLVHENIDGQWVVFPTLDHDGSKWLDMRQTDGKFPGKAWEYAKKNKTVIKMPDEKTAEYMATNGFIDHTGNKGGEKKTEYIGTIISPDRLQVEMDRVGFKGTVDEFLKITSEKGGSIIKLADGTYMIKK